MSTVNTGSEGLCTFVSCPQRPILDLGVGAGEINAHQYSEFTVENTRASANCNYSFWNEEKTRQKAL